MVNRDFVLDYKKMIMTGPNGNFTQYGEDQYKIYIQLVGFGENDDPNDYTFFLSVKNLRQYYQGELTLDMYVAGNLLLSGKLPVGCLDRTGNLYLQVVCVKNESATKLAFQLCTPCKCRVNPSLKKVNREVIL